MKKYIILLIILISNLYTCSQEVKRNESLSNEMIESSIKQDTLVIVSTADYLFHPFNKTTEPSLFYPKIKFKIQEKDKIYKLNFKNSFVNLQHNVYRFMI